MIGVTFKDFYMCVSLIYKDKLQDNYSIFNGFLLAQLSARGSGA